MNIPGYSGRILFVDLTERKFKIESIDPALVSSFLGGHGFNYKLIYDLIPPDVDPFAPENGIFIATGPFSGTIVPGSAELMITEKLPLSRGFGTHAGGGHFPIMLKSCGYDQMVILGRSDKPVYVIVHESGVDFKDASNLWGRDAHETVDELRRYYEPCSIIPIGPAGENLVPISVTSMDKLGTIGFGGLPAVMGSKNLKAILAIKGSKEIKVANPSTFLEKVDRMMKRIMEYRMRPLIIEGGTYAMTSEWFKSMGLDTDAWIKIHTEARKPLACPSCPMGDKERVRLREGEFSPMITHMTHFMGDMENSANSDLDNHNRVVKRMDELNRMGICTINFRQTLDLLVSLYRDGIISKEDTGGIELFPMTFEKGIYLIGLTARREAIGDIIAEGPLGAARRLGEKAVERACHIKGCGLFIEPRLESMNTMAFSQLVHPGRPNYACGGIGIYMPGRPVEQFVEHAKRIGMIDMEIERIFTKDSYDVGRLTKHAEDWFSLFNCMGQCHRLYIHRFHSIDTFCDFFNSITGVEMDKRGLLMAGERVWNLHKILNIRAGLGKKDDLPPEQWFKPLRTSKGDLFMRDYFNGEVVTRERVEGFLASYYDERGWDPETGKPTEKKLQELGLTKFS